MSELLKLAERVEALSGPDRALDLAIAEAIGSSRVRNGSINISASVTALLDAAMTLVPEGWWLAGLNYCPVDFRSSHDREWHAEFAGPITWAVVDREVGEEPQYECEGGNAATPALALCAAALRARAFQQ